MDKVVGIAALLALLIFLGRGMPLRSWPLVIAATLALVVAIVLIERAGYWPRGWTTR
jgi:hypothetical protein